MTYRNLENIIRDVANKPLQSKTKAPDIVTQPTGTYTMKDVLNLVPVIEGVVIPEIIEPEVVPEPEPVVEETVEVVEVVNPVAQKLAAQRQQIAKQRGQMKVQFQQAKANKEMGAEKNKEQKELSKIKEDEFLDEGPSYGQANAKWRDQIKKYHMYLAAGDVKKAEQHRKKAEQYKRAIYAAKPKD